MGPFPLPPRARDPPSLVAATARRVDSLDALVELARIAAAAGTPVLSKEDFIGAYNTLPVRGADLPLAHAAWAKGANEGYCLQLLSCPFGAVGSGYAWDRVGAALQARGAATAASQRAPRARQAILAKLFWLASGRFVDDLFRADADGGPGTGGPRDAAKVLRAVVEDLLGWRLDAGKRVVAEPRANVLGVDAEVRGSGEELSLVFAIGTDKRDKWTQEIEGALAAGRMSPAAASKLAGRLGWGSTAVFGRGARGPPRARNARARGRGARCPGVPRTAVLARAAAGVETEVAAPPGSGVVVAFPPERARTRGAPAGGPKPAPLPRVFRRDGRRQAANARARRTRRGPNPAHASTAGWRGSSSGPAASNMRRPPCPRPLNGGRGAAKRRRGRPDCRAGSGMRSVVRGRSQRGNSSRQYARCII